jgi:beta-ureidopropionase / N-carbamoyl-L-amino-acid hydrolase
MMAETDAERALSAGEASDRALAEELFEALRKATSDGVGITREAYSDRESAALDIIEAKARTLGLKAERDAGANLVVTLEGSEPSLPFVACGSHLDSVPQGGNFDGGAGVVAGLAILARFKEVRLSHRRSLKLYALRGEESAGFGKAYMGSSALFGLLTPADLSLQDGRSGRTLGDCMADVGVDTGRVAKGEPLLDAKSAAAWIELHIEQGPVLEAQGLPVGIVTGLRGNIRHRAIECLGESGHSGAVPRWLRRDAVFATADLIGRLDRAWARMLENGHDLVVTLGVIGTVLEEHAIARIPGRVRFSFDARSQSEATLESFYRRFLSECGDVEKERGVTFKLDRMLSTPPAVMEPYWILRLKGAAKALGLDGAELPSGAGHDAAVFANAGVPSAMIFVRNQHGSHNPRESMEIDDFVKGIAVMRVAIREAII